MALSAGDGAPALTVLIPTHDRPHLLPQAVESALAQTVRDLEVVVVDDGSPEPVRPAGDPRVRLVRLDRRQGNAGARNAGLAAARGRWLTCLDDDDLLLPHHAEVAIAALERTTLPPPVGVLTGVERLAPGGSVARRSLPPTLPRGSHFALEALPPGRSFLTKQTLVVETAVLRAIGGWDASFESRTATELFLRLNPVCSLLGLDEVTYRLRAHEGPRVSADRRLRQASFGMLTRKHRAAFRAHPQRYAALLLEHARMSVGDGERRAALVAAVQAARWSPATVARRRRDVAKTVRGALRTPASR